MHVIIWELVVREGSAAAFEEAYGPSGAWAKLFAHSEEYLGTELLRDDDDPRRYVTIDRWTTASAFLKLREEHAREYATLDALCDGWTERETRLAGGTVVS
ncbi:MAG: antibiotic biosynthesis monooxygenase family protein [Acidobacteriota bacterium]